MASGKSSDSVRIPNLGKIQAALKELGASNAQLQQASFEAGQITARSMQAFIAPISKSGRLARSVKASKIVRKVQVTIGNNTTVKYAAPINFGWRDHNIKGARFIERALRNTRQRVLDTYIDSLQRLVNQLERKTK